MFQRLRLEIPSFLKLLHHNTSSLVLKASTPQLHIYQTQPESIWRKPEMQSSGLSVCLPNFNPTPLLPLITARRTINSPKLAAVSVIKKSKIKCSSSDDSSARRSLFQTCKNCKTQFDPALNHPLACRFHPAHFGGETKRKFESVHTGGTMNTPNSGQVLEYWHCCGSEDAFDPGCTSSPHLSYDD